MWVLNEKRCKTYVLGTSTFSTYFIRFELFSSEKLFNTMDIVS